MPDDQASSSRPKHWVFCSSGARPLFLENIVRALALPSGDRIKYRYEADLVSETFRDLVGETTSFSRRSVVGDTAYLSFLDNRDKSRAPVVYPVREAIIKSVSVLGTTYVVELQLQCVLDWSADGKMSSTIAQLAIDDLPGWLPKADRNDERDWHGCWLAATNPLPNECFSPYSAPKRTHLSAFESCVNALSQSTDFSDGKRLFANVLGLRDREEKHVRADPILKAGRTYELAVYHYQPGDGTHNPLENFRIVATTDNPDVTVLGDPERHVEARYDEISFPLHVREDAKDGRVNIGLIIKRLDGGQTEPLYILRGEMMRRVKSSRGRKIGFGVLIGLGLFGAQAATLFAAKEPPSAMTIVIAIAFSLVAGLGASFQVKTKI
tara:strand:- start:612 stop:1754 length:1143 start_codon:yes stop_codon:yes gene_type:complete